MVDKNELKTLELIAKKVLDKDIWKKVRKVKNKEEKVEV